MRIHLPRTPAEGCALTRAGRLRTILDPVRNGLRPAAQSAVSTDCAAGSDRRSTRAAGHRWQPDRRSGRPQSESPRRASWIAAATTRNVPENAPPIAARPAFSRSPSVPRPCPRPPVRAAPDAHRPPRRTDPGGWCPAGYSLAPPRAASDRKGAPYRTGTAMRTMEDPGVSAATRRVDVRVQQARGPEDRDVGARALDPPLVRDRFRRFRRYRSAPRRPGTQKPLPVWQGLVLGLRDQTRAPHSRAGRITSRRPTMRRCTGSSRPPHLAHSGLADPAGHYRLVLVNQAGNRPLRPQVR